MKSARRSPSRRRPIRSGRAGSSMRFVKRRRSSRHQEPARTRLAGAEQRPRARLPRLSTGAGRPGQATVNHPLGAVFYVRLTRVGRDSGTGQEFICEMRGLGRGTEFGTYVSKNQPGHFVLASTSWALRRARELHAGNGGARFQWPADLCKPGRARPAAGRGRSPSSGARARPSAPRVALLLLMLLDPARSSSSFARSSGVNSSPKSSASKKGRISISDSSPGIGSGQRFTHSTASSIDFTFQIQKPAMSSLVSANGPSMTVRLPPAGEAHPLALRARLQAVARLHDAGFHQLLVELHHVGEQLLRRHHARFAVFRGLHDHHDSHRRAPLYEWFGHSIAEWGGCGSTFSERCRANATPDRPNGRQKPAISQRFGSSISGVSR